MRRGPCMCGDLCCSSCGPAQGNSRCLVCGEWASEGCENPEECAAKMPAALEADRLAVEEEAKWYAEMERFERNEAEAEIDKGVCDVD